MKNSRTSRAIVLALIMGALVQLGVTKRVPGKHPPDTANVRCHGTSIDEVVARAEPTNNSTALFTIPKGKTIEFDYSVNGRQTINGIYKWLKYRVLDSYVPWGMFTNMTGYIDCVDPEF